MAPLTRKTRLNTNFAIAAEFTYAQICFSDFQDALYEMRVYNMEINFSSKGHSTEMPLGFQVRVG